MEKLIQSIYDSYEERHQKSMYESAVEQYIEMDKNGLIEHPLFVGDIRDEMSAQCRADYRKEYAKQYYQRNITYYQEYYQKNKDKIKASSEKWRISHSKAKDTKEKIKCQHCPKLLVKTSIKAHNVRFHPDTINAPPPSFLQ